MARICDGSGVRVELSPAILCSCGETEDHRIARRTTANGSFIYLWADGAITWVLGRYVKGSPHPRTAEQRRAALAAGWFVMEDVALYNNDEVPDLIAAARWAIARGLDASAMRQRYKKRRQ